MGKDLAKLLANKFLTPDYEKHALGWVANYAISEATIEPVQEYVASLVRGLGPTPAHQILTTFHSSAPKRVNLLVKA